MDSFTVAALDTFASLLCGIVVLSFDGVFAFQMDVDVPDIASSGRLRCNVIHQQYISCVHSP